MKPLVIIGASPFGELLQILAEDSGRTVAGFVDDFAEEGSVMGTTSDLGQRLSCTSFDLVMAIGYRHLQRRLELFDLLRRQGFSFPALSHPAAFVSRKAIVGEGAVVMAGANIDAFAEVGDACVLWPQATISHDCRVGRNTFISPAATLCGFVEVGPSSFIGANSVIVDSSVLPASSFVKAGSRHNSRPQQQ
ncbi:acetyltransferase [Stenotrophomonas maltophilia]|uniref:acetyltransferase n=1 Tax=Stenotrophomonas maltophilia TaxID=40324 RepID=UPI0005B6FA97|nr:acetyltransferase [Stenotrophomonas maltophilia]KIS40182.1 acetyltransferase EpsM [Stenotrophomonas maltophilia WJ66]MCF3459263.1 hypothetical protein [Stenotrophomonas maltophilia]MCF3516182.1 hypothetical protein [Stenotrophomonas maltophilia]NYB79140.1 acetyltransferase [Stenotrophomonas maltophilia]